MGCTTNIEAYIEATNFLKATNFVKSIQENKIPKETNQITNQIDLSKYSLNWLIKEYYKKGKDQAIQDELPRLPKIFVQ